MCGPKKNEAEYGLCKRTEDDKDHRQITTKQRQQQNTLLRDRVLTVAFSYSFGGVRGENLGEFHWSNGTQFGDTNTRSAGRSTCFWGHSERRNTRSTWIICECKLLHAGFSSKVWFGESRDLENTPGIYWRMLAAPRIFTGAHGKLLDMSWHPFKFTGCLLEFSKTH